MEPSPLAEPQSQHHSQPGPTPSSGPQIRSRVTVVCAECKRLKLKCDRRTPCGSCTKRDTVARCVYSPAAAEKVDLHSLNNRLIQVESQLAQFTAPGARSHNFYNQLPGPSTQSDRPLLAVGPSGSSLALSLDDITAIWLDELDLSKDILPAQSPPLNPSCPAYASSHVKLEPTPTTLPSHDASSPSDPPIHLLLPPLTAYYASSSPTAIDTPSVNPRLFAHLPFAPRRRQKLYDNVEDVLKMHPCFNFKHFKDRAEAMFKWSSEVDGHDSSLVDPLTTQNAANGTHSAATKLETACAIFFGPSTPSSSRTTSTPKPTLSFFAAVAASFALGTLVDREVAEEEARLDVAHGDSVTRDDPSSRPPPRKKPDQLPIANKKCKGIAKDALSSPAVLLALSQQALSLFERSSPYDLDFLVAMILHVLYALHDSRARVVHTLLPEVGKMVNIARTMGLDMDPDEFPGKFNLFEAESRRRLWWDLFYYDLFISDYMGCSPLISDTEHTTRLPMDVDEDVFTPACTTIPLPRSPLSLVEPNSSDFKYFGLKCRLAQLVKDIKRRSLRDSIQNDPAAHEQFTLEQAASCANEIKQWFADLPSTFRIDIDSDPGATQAPRTGAGSSSFANPGESTSVSPVLMAQRCELAVMVQRLIMKVYIPFLRPSYGHGNSTSYYQATVGTFTAAHSIIRSLKALCTMWKQRPDLRGRRPIPALFSFYSFSRALFDAAVACAHNVIKDPNSIWVHTAFEDVSYALEVLRDPMLNTGRGSVRGGVEGSVQEAIKIVELLRRKAENARSGSSDAASAGTKRKHDEIEADVEQMRRGFRLPFVSAPVMSAGVLTADTTVPPLPATGTPRLATTPSSLPPDHQARTISRTGPAEEQHKRPPSVASKQGPHPCKPKDKNAKKPYPQTGIRVRKEPSPFTKLCIPPATPTTPSTDSDPPPPARQVPSIAPSPGLEHPPYLQPPTSFPPASQTLGSHPSVPPKLDGASVDFLVPFSARDDATQAAGQMNPDVSQARRYCQTEMSQEVSSSQPVAKVSTAVATFERPHGGPFASSSPASYAPSSGSYSNINSPYPSGGTQFSTTPSHEQQSPPFDMSATTQGYYSYDHQVQTHPMTLVGVNHGGDDVSFQMRDQAVSQNGGLFQFQQDKPHQGIYPSERHPSVSQSQFREQHVQSIAQAWTPQAGAISEGSGFWPSYHPFTA
ncbi:hypothetical protein JVT61DRAFT_1466 [Boletus reticuloceps]|uniref:Zn(2)-C6 fungal-type domain-containing protein n=1 Tax=Boletus reticuloceps TaxID=495285 RepID=A0A8I3A297_9AGAM|nr:hypothetical protein JVT61DRAFT_1466 [Boletus reticuloceps]